MKTSKINTTHFERDCIATFEKMLQGYVRASQSIAWDSNMDVLTKKLTHLPNAPFPIKLMELFDYNYLALSENIKSIIDKALVIRKEMEEARRLVKENRQYSSLSFFSKNTHLKRFDKLLQWLTPCNKKIWVQNILKVKQKSIQYKELEIYYYSPFIDLSTINSNNYYDFFCDYYGKMQFVKYLNTKDKNNLRNANRLDEMLILNSSQQVLWAYFFLDL